MTKLVFAFLFLQLPTIPTPDLLRKCLVQGEFQNVYIGPLLSAKDYKPVTSVSRSIRIRWAEGELTNQFRDWTSAVRVVRASTSYYLQMRIRPSEVGILQIAAYDEGLVSMRQLYFVVKPSGRAQCEAEAQKRTP